MPALLALAPEVIAAIALVAILAAYFLTQLIVATLRATHVDAIPIVGGAITGAANYIASGIASLAGWLWQHANPINMFLATVHWSQSLFATVVNGLAWDIYSTIQRVISVTIPTIANALHTVAMSAILSLTTWTGTLYNQALAFATNAVAGAESIAAADIRALTTWTGTLYNQMVATAAADLGIAERWADDRYNQAIDYVGAKVGELTHYIDQGIGDVRAWAGGELNALRGIITGTLLPAIAAAAAAAAAVAADFAKWRSECGDPLCNNLSTFGNELNALENAFDDVAILALLAAAIADPQGLANEINSVVAGPVEAVWGELSGAIGLRAA